MPYPDDRLHTPRRDPKARIEPWLGAGRSADPGPAPGPFQSPPGPDADGSAGRLAAPRRWGRGVAVAALAVLVLLGVLFLLRPVLSEWLWPQTRAQQLRDRAVLALQAGRLTAADGSGARELYEAALALEPDRTDARAGLARVGYAALARAREAVEQRRYPQAHQALELARELDVPQAEIDALQERLREREAGDVGLGQLLAQATAAREAGRLDGSPGAALPLYQRVLELQPGQTTALEGREDVLTDLLRLARQALQRDALGQAAALVARVRDADPGHVGLPEAIATLAEHVARRRQQADEDLEAGRLEEALAGYRVLLVADPDDAEAARGFERVAAVYAGRSERLASDFRFDQALVELQRASAVAPDAPAVAAAEEHLRRMRRSQGRLQGGAGDAGRQRRVQQLLQEAAAARSRGELLSPPGESMFDKLRAARALAPGDPRVMQASAQLLPAMHGCFDESLRSNDLGRAQGCLDALHALGADDGQLQASRSRLAQRWIAVGDQWLGAGRLADARRALRSARELDPATPGLADFAARVRTADPAVD